MGAVRLRNVGDAVHLYAPPDSPNSLPVDEGQVITVPGPLDETDDAWVCGTEDPRAFPKSRWALVEPTKAPRKAAAKAADRADDEKGGEG